MNDLVEFIMELPSLVRVRVPASSANLGPGFDTLALALGLHLHCTLRRTDQALRIRASGVDAASIPCDSTNLVWKAFCRIAGDVVSGADLEIDNELPLGRGLGSSAAAIIAGLALGNEWVGRRHSGEDLVQMATEMEGHPDNVAAAARGGLVASCQRADGSVLSMKIPMRSGLDVVLVSPDYPLSTEAARHALPQQYSRADAVFNVQRVALLVAALRDGNFDVLAEAMRDRMHQPYRAPLVPGFAEALALSGVPGLLGVALSGAGPSVIAFCAGRTHKVGEAIAACFRKHGVHADAHVLLIDHDGLVVERVD